MNIEWLIVLVISGVFFVFAALVFRSESEWPSYVAAGLLLVLFFALVTAVSMSVARRSCRVIGELNGWGHQYSYTNKCLLEVEPGRWIPKSAVYSQVEDLPQ